MLDTKRSGSIYSYCKVLYLFNLLINNIKIEFEILNKLYNNSKSSYT